MEDLKGVGWQRPQVTSDVPQGSLLGPFLLVLFIEKVLRVHEEKDLGVVISDKLPWLMNKMSGKLV